MSKNKVMQTLALLLRTGVEIGTGVIVHDCLNAMSNKYVKRRDGAIGVLKELCVLGASTAITFKASSVMGEYVTKQTDEAQESFDDMIATLDDIAARVRRENKKDIDISTKTEEEANDGEANTEDNTETSGN